MLIRTWQKERVVRLLVSLDTRQRFSSGLYVTQVRLMLGVGECESDHDIIV